MHRRSIRERSVRVRDTPEPLASLYGSSFESPLTIEENRAHENNIPNNVHGVAPARYTGDAYLRPIRVYATEGADRRFEYPSSPATGGTNASPSLLFSLTRATIIRLHRFCFSSISLIILLRFNFLVTEITGEGYGLSRSFLNR